MDSTERSVNSHAHSEIGAAVRLLAQQATSDRICGSCTMCCKLPMIPVLDKQAGQWCRHCTPGVGCTIYDERPAMCREFFCQWIENASLPDYWKPEASKIILTRYPRTGFLYAMVDPARPDAWKAPRLLADLQRWAAQLMDNHRHVVVFVNEDATLIMPDQAVPMGRMRQGEGFMVRTTYPQGKLVYSVSRA